MTPDRFWLTRHYIALSTLVTVCIALFSPGSLNARSLDASGQLGWVLCLLLALCSGLLLLEASATAFVSRQAMPWLRARRHTLLMAVAVGNLANAYLVFAYSPSTGALMLRFALDASVATLVAFLDLIQRHRCPEE